jgi:hypothetical protein
MNSPLPGQRRILSNARLHELLYSGAANAGEKYSFGWGQNQIDGHPGVFAQGGTYDSFALLQLLPKQDIAVAVLANTGTTLPFEIANRIVAQLLHTKTPAKSSAKHEEKTDAPQHVLSGQWLGVVSTSRGDVPLNLTISSPNQVRATVGGATSACVKAEVSSSRIDCIVAI